MRRLPACAQRVSHAWVLGLGTRTPDAAADAPGAAGAVQVSDGVPRRVQAVHVRDRRQVQPARSRGRRQQERRLVVPERVQRLNRRAHSVRDLDGAVLPRMQASLGLAAQGHSLHQSAQRCPSSPRVVAPRGGGGRDIALRVDKGAKIGTVDSRC